MAIKYYLQPNPITPEPNDQTARILSHKVHDVDSIIQLMLRRGSTVTEADVRAVLTVLFDVVSDEVADGNNVNLPIVNIRPSITGIFTSVSDSYDESRHAKKGSTSAGTMLTTKMKWAKVEKVNQPTPTPSLIQFTDINLGSINSLLTPGSIGQLIGEELKFNHSNPEEGIYFIASDGTQTKVDVIANRTEGKLVFIIPTNLPPGNYKLEVRKGYGTTTIVVRSSSLATNLQVP